MLKQCAAMPCCRMFYLGLWPGSHCGDIHSQSCRRTLASSQAVHWREGVSNRFALCVASERNNMISEGNIGKAWPRKKEHERRSHERSTLKLWFRFCMISCMVSDAGLGEHSARPGFKANVDPCGIFQTYKPGNVKMHQNVQNVKTLGDLGPKTSLGEVSAWSWRQGRRFL